MAFLDFVGNIFLGGLGLLLVWVAITLVGGLSLMFWTHCIAAAIFNAREQSHDREQAKLRQSVRFLVREALDEATQDTFEPTAVDIQKITEEVDKSLAKRVRQQTGVRGVVEKEKE